MSLNLYVTSVCSAEREKLHLQATAHFRAVAEETPESFPSVLAIIFERFSAGLNHLW